MALEKQSVPISFNLGLDTKSDKFQVKLGNFLTLENSIFSVTGALTKRNGFGQLTALPDSSSTFLTTFNGNLTSLGTNLEAYNKPNDTWVSKGVVHSASLSTLPLIRSSTNQTQVDAAIAPNGLICTVYTDAQPAGTSYRYAIADTTSGQNIVAPTVIAPTAGAITNPPRVFILGNYFLILFSAVISAVNYIQYIAISYNSPSNPTAAAILTNTFGSGNTNTFDGTVAANGSLYVAWNTNAGGAGTVKMRALDSSLVLSSIITPTAHAAAYITVASDSNCVYVVYSISASGNIRDFVVDFQLNTVSADALMFTNTNLTTNMTSSAISGIDTVVFEQQTVLSYDSGIQYNSLFYRTLTNAGGAGSSSSIASNLGLASKALRVNETVYFLTTYGYSTQPTYFLMNLAGNIISRFAYSNGGGWLTTGLPSISATDSTLQVPYLYKDLISATNKTQGAASTAGVYSQTGINLASITLNPAALTTSEIGNNLNISGGFLWAYDGYSLVENGFFLYPDFVEPVVSHSGGSMTTQDYFYSVTYEWSDNQGNVFRSAPSIPVKAPSASFSGSSNSVTIHVPYLQATYKTANPAKIVIYRWSTAQQTYYQVTSLTTPSLNVVGGAQALAFVDTLADGSIIGNNILYTTGGVIENISPPATDLVTISQSRLFLVDSEDRNLLWYSKQIIEATPVEMSDLLTIYVNPTIGAQGSTGVMSALSALDDKTIIFKKDAIYYINGVGPDNTGANSQFSDPIFVTATVGCENQNSIVFMPKGLMFQSDKGIWLLGRDLQTEYIGWNVEGLTQNSTVLSSVNVPGTNEVRFTLSSGITLMYDYFYNQWSTFVGASAISSTLYESLHTCLDKYGRVLQETPGEYLDGSNPVLMSFTTSWLNLAGLQGYERAYFFYLLGTYITPHKISLQIAFDYNPSPIQVSVISPDNYTGKYGSDPLYGSSEAYGGIGTVEQYRVFLKQQKCEAFQITMKESYDSSFGVQAGEGLSLSGLNLIVGLKSGYPRLRATKSVG